ALGSIVFPEHSGFSHVANDCEGTNSTFRSTSYFATTMHTTTSEFLTKGLSFVGKQRDSEFSESLFGNVFSLLKQTFQEWLEDKVPQLGAALAYYTVFSLAPLVLVMLAI